jgi:hypothetical protein
MELQSPKIMKLIPSLAKCGITARYACLAIIGARHTKPTNIDAGQAEIANYADVQPISSPSRYCD